VCVCLPYFLYQVPKRKSKKQQLTDAACAADLKKKKSFYSFFRGATENVLLEIKNTLIQIFHRPEEESVNKAILEELKQIRMQLIRSERRMTVKDGEQSFMDIESDTEKPQAVVDKAVKPQAVTNLEPKPAEEPEEELDLFDGDPNNPPWIRDPELGDGTVSTDICLFNVHHK